MEAALDSKGTFWPLSKTVENFCGGKGTIQCRLLCSRESPVRCREGICRTERWVAWFGTCHFLDSQIWHPRSLIHL